jgi:phage regulator Rha-like protein
MNGGNMVNDLVVIGKAGNAVTDSLKIAELFEKAAQRTC